MEDAKHLHSSAWAVALTRFTEEALKFQVTSCFVHAPGCISELLEPRRTACWEFILCYNSIIY